MALTVEVVSRENVVWTGEASYVRVRTMNGDLGIYPGLIPTCALLAEDGELLIRPVNGGELTTRLHDGFLTVSNDKVTIAGSEKKGENPFHRKPKGS